MSSDDIVVVLGPDGSQQNTTVAEIDASNNSSFSQTINAAAQMGALFIMLVVVLVMTPKARFKLPPTIISILALVFQLAHMIFLTVYFVSGWNTFDTQVLGDLSGVARVDYNISVAGTLLGLPVTILVELALIVQAYSMIRLWPKTYRAIAGVVSFAIVLATIVMDFYFVIVQVRFILWNIPNEDWLSNTYYILLTASIAWFCFLFIIRLVIHMWEKRTILPSINGLNAMDALVITNGVLMVIPIVFAALQFTSSVDFYAFSLTQTSVVLVLPLGSLVAQRLSNPSLFSHPATPDTANNNSAVSGMSSQARKPLLIRRPSNATSGASFRPGQAGGGAAPGVTSQACFEKSETSHFDRELAQIDDVDLERGLGRVRVDRRIESSEERIPDTVDISTRGHESS